MSNKQTTISKDAANKKLIVVREVDAPLEDVWKAWTDSNILDQWWAPKPWRAKTKTMDFREGGMWLYSMVGPDALSHIAVRISKQLLKIRALLLTTHFVMRTETSLPISPVCIGRMSSAKRIQEQRLRLKSHLTMKQIWKKSLKWALRPALQQLMVTLMNYLRDNFWTLLFSPDLQKNTGKAGH